MRLLRSIRDLVRLDTRDQVCLAAAWSLLGLCRLAILVLPFTLVRRALGEHGARPADADTHLDHATLVRARRIGLCVERAARHTPWRSECYPQAVTARLLLGAARIPHVVSFGVRRDGDALVAHAWVTAGLVVVTGGSGQPFTEVGTFTWTPRTRRSG